VNDKETHIGEGFVTFAIRPGANCATGDEINAKASIVFDVNDALETNTWLNTIDAVAPTSKLQGVNMGNNTHKFTFTANDDLNGSGVKSIYVYASVNNAGYDRIATCTPGDEYSFEAIPGNIYAFYSLAEDFTGNLEAAKSEPEYTINLNVAPEDLLLSNTAFSMQAPIGKSVGTFTSIDSNEGDLDFTYALVSGEGDTNNSLFTIDGDVLKVNADFSKSRNSTFSIRVRTTDAGGLSFEKAFTLTISDFVKSQISGDANDDGVVDIADVNITVDYITGKNPAGFVFNLADVDGDGVIKINDIVGIIDIIRNPQGSGTTQTEQGTAGFTLQNLLITVFSDTNIGGLDASLTDESAANVQILPALDGFEIVKYVKSGTLHVMAYSVEGNVLNKQEIIELLNLSSEKAIISGADACDPEGHSLLVNINNIPTGINVIPNQLIGIYPNPVKQTALIKYIIGEEITELRFLVYDISGRVVNTMNINSFHVGVNETEWHRKGLASGVYQYSLVGYNKKKLISINKGKFILE